MRRGCLILQRLTLMHSGWLHVIHLVFANALEVAEIDRLSNSHTKTFEKIKVTGVYEAYRSRLSILQSMCHVNIYNIVRSINISLWLYQLVCSGRHMPQLDYRYSHMERCFCKEIGNLHVENDLVGETPQAHVSANVCLKAVAADMPEPINMTYFESKAIRPAGTEIARTDNVTIGCQ